MKSEQHDPADPLLQEAWPSLERPEQFTKEQEWATRMDTTGLPTDSRTAPTDSAELARANAKLREEIHQLLHHSLRQPYNHTGFDRCDLRAAADDVLSMLIERERSAPVAAPPAIEVVRQRATDFGEGYHAGYDDGLEGNASDSADAWARSRASKELAAAADPLSVSGTTPPCGYHFSRENAHADAVVGTEGADTKGHRQHKGGLPDAAGEGAADSRNSSNGPLGQAVGEAGGTTPDLTIRQKTHVLIAETRRCIEDDAFTTALRKLDALDALLKAASASSPAPSESKT